MPRQDVGASGEALFLSHLDLIERAVRFVCGRQHLSSEEADDFGSHVKLKLIEHDYSILRRFEGRSSLQTYLTVVIQRLFLDYRISAWGKWRPSAEAKRGGAVALLLERLTARDGFTFEEACEQLRTNHGVTLEREALERMAARLPVRTRRRFETDEALDGVASSDRGPDAGVADRERESLAARLSRALQAVSARLETQDRLILALRFEDGRTVADISTMLRLDQKGLYRRLERLLKEMRLGLEAEGVDAAAVMEMLDSPAVHIEWSGREAAEKEKTGPSMAKGAEEWR